MKCRYVINAGTKDQKVSDGQGSHSPFVTALLQSSVGTGDDEECDVELLKKEHELRELGVVFWGRVAHRVRV